MKRLALFITLTLLLAVDYYRPVKRYPMTLPKG